jgi:hypothetical protein
MSPILPRFGQAPSLFVRYHPVPWSTSRFNRNAAALSAKSFQRLGNFSTQGDIPNYRRIRYETKPASWPRRRDCRRSHLAFRVVLAGPRTKRHRRRRSPCSPAGLLRLAVEVHAQEFILVDSKGRQEAIIKTGNVQGTNVVEIVNSAGKVVFTAGSSMARPLAVR